MQLKDKPPRQPINRAAQALFRKQFEEVGALPFAWQGTAESLMRAADALLPLVQAETHPSSDDSSPTALAVPVGAVYMMLAGFAIENLAKAAIISQGQPSTSNDKLAKDLNTHDLVDLLGRAAVTLTAEESFLAERLQVFVEWAGRYPIPSSVEKALPRMAPLGGSAPLNHMLGSDPAAIEMLVAKLS